MSPPLICRVGEALYGPHWVRPLAAALGVSERTMRYWQDGTREPPPGIYRELSAMATTRRAELSALKAEISATVKRSGDQD